MNKKFTLLARYLLAIVFIFSGFVKGVDPWGTAYKLHDYFLAFHLDFLDNLSLVFSFILCVAELYIGLLLLFGVKLRLAAWGAFLFMLVFTPLTLILALTNPISDCGCFGDAIKLSNWGTFIKNIFFFIAAAILFASRKSITSKFSVLKEFAVAILLLAISLLPSIHGIRHQPLIDFRPFHVGANLLDYTTVPDDAPQDVYKTILYYEKDGVVKEFDESNYPWNDSTWTFVDSKSYLVQKGYTPLINNFVVYSEDGHNYTDSILYSDGYLLLPVIPYTKYLTKEADEVFNKINKKAFEKGIKIFGLVSASGKDLLDLEQKHRLFFPMLQADEVMLKTIVRSQPGLLLLYNGTIIGKWHWRDIPKDLLDVKNPHAYLIKTLKKSNENYQVLAISISLLLLLLLINVNTKNRR
ncbi:BT_3928 family protein [Tenuifilum thalassicum]|uniref:DoxX family membrane protein n=1 Tax=Tenuifilum thalassicum TaxID=2590900 RepID=A0A7D4BZI7_9BACT|nr:BT_3928 family protein [Tenuifilum thalassicum]QKG79724.1 DoxX family membrane protein [Tenuifilum thalassicum]